MPAFYRIRPAALSDLDDLVRLERATFETDRLSRRSLRNFILSPRVALLVAHNGARLAGYVLLAFRRGSLIARLYSVAVDKDHGQRGIGHGLLDAAMAQARARGARILRLEVRSDNVRAIGLYQKLGFRSFGRYADYYEDGGSAERMERQL
jgi:[ribosomal protein S18]-alanine N-acetyltransferase